MFIEKMKIKSATGLYLAFGLILLGVLVFGLIAFTIHFIINPSELYLLLIIWMPFGLFYIFTYVLLNAWRRRKEIDIYFIKKTGIINFDDIDKSLVQIADFRDKMFFVKEQDYKYYLDFAIIQGLRG